METLVKERPVGFSEYEGFHPVGAVEALYENNITGDDGNSEVSSLQWWGQTFTPSTTHTITKVKLLLWRHAVQAPGLITVGIKATDGDGKPTGSYLCSGTTNGNTLSTSSPGEWREIEFSAGVELSTGTRYAIVVEEPGNPAAGIHFHWRFNSGGNGSTYTSGDACYSLNSGVTWTLLIYDMMFEEWGTGPGGKLPVW